MKTTALVLAPLAIALATVFDASAQDHSQHHVPTPATQDHAEHQHEHPAQKPETTPAPKVAPAAEPNPSTDHHSMDHGSMDHAAHSPTEVDHAAMGHAMPRAAGEPRTPIPALTDADRAAAQPPSADHPMHDDTVHSFVLLDRLEGFDADQGRGLEWEGQAWIGKDLDKLWLRSKGERVGGHTEAASLEVLYGRAVARWWDAVVGVRHDFKPGDSQDFLAIGLMGMAPYKFEVAATGYIGRSGQTAAQVEVEYETLLTNRLILQPQLELEFHGRNDPSRGIGSGLSTAEAGLRLRYEFTRRLAPYIGIVREWSFGRTADLRREEGEPVSDTRVVAGFRVWF